MTAIAISRLHFPVRSLGPGARIGIWFQGCSIGCAGCISPDTWATGTGETTVAHILDQLFAWAESAAGLTVSGGEPLDQPEALAGLLAGWRKLSDSPVLLFTGYRWAVAESWFARHPGLVDAVIAGPYVRTAGATLAMRGSDNQTLHILSERGDGFRQFNREKTPQDRHLDVMFDDDGTVWLAGIPGRQDFERLREILAQGGHSLVMAPETQGSGS
ncbi:MAG: 4Fe-4S cluster-binding domain-containing protein [Allosphingosinicella sp.]